MEKCPQCESENPSSANHCMKCGAPLGKGRLPEEVLLRQQLAEANNTIAHLNDSLSEVQTKASVATEKVKWLQAKNAVMEKLKSQNDSLMVENKKIKEDLTERKKKSGWKWGFLFVMLFANITIIFALISTSGSVETLEKENNELKTYLGNYPLLITDIEIANVDAKNNIQTDYGEKINHKYTMFLKPKLSYQSLVEYDDFSLDVKLFNPNGTLSTGKYSPSGLTYSEKCHISRGCNTLYLSSWGYWNKGYWKRGTYRIEVWYGDICLKSKTFQID
ncbi:MAG: hypothetical protein J5606_02280 [Bacteroidales bacterium]|nr:hypothetical protein [Bacteroidales bacterium]